MINFAKIKTLSVIFLISCGCLLLVEGAGRLVIRYIEFKKPTGTFGEKILSHQEPLLGFGLKKNLDEDMGGWHVSTNSLGLRDKPLEANKAEKESRLFLVGGSTVFGWGVNDSESIPSLLQKKLDEEGYSHVRVINAGVPWYASWHETALILFRVLDYHPDWIITLDGLNDVAQGLSPEWAPVSLGYLDPPTRIAMERRNLDPNQRSFFTHLLHFSEPFTYFSAKLRAREGLARGVYHPELWEQYARHKERVSAIATAQGIRFTNVFQPVIVLDKTLTAEERERDGTNMRFTEFADTFRKAYLEGEKKLLQNSKLNAFSLKEAFKGTKELIYTDGQHYNTLGNKILAQALWEREVLPHLQAGKRSNTAENRTSSVLLARRRERR